MDGHCVTEDRLGPQYFSSDDLTLGADAQGVMDSPRPGGPGGAPAPFRGWSATTSAPMLASPVLADLDGDGVDEILLTTYGITNPYGEGWLYAWDGAGNSLPGFPIHLTGAAPGTAAVGDLDGDGTVEIVQGTWNYLYVFNADGTNAPGWPKSNYITQAASLADLDNDGTLEIIVPVSNSMKVYHHDGTSYSGFPVTVTNSLTAAAVGDMDNDGDLEIVSGSFVASGSPSDNVFAWHHDGSAVAGFPTVTAGSVKAAPILADLDGDGFREVVADCWNKSGTDELYVWDHTGADEPGWPQSIPYIRLSSPSVGDLDGDGDLEIVVGGWSTNPSGEVINALHHTAAAVSGFPVVLNNSPSGNVNSTCVIADIDGDEDPEIVVKAANNIFATNSDGTIVSGFPLPLDDESHSGTTSPTPALGDPDNDGLIEIFAASSFNNVALFDLSGFKSDDLVYWPMYRNGETNRGIYDAPSLAADNHQLSVGTGGSVDFALNGSPLHAGRNYLLTGSVSGTAPGTLLPGGQAVIPLNRDWFTDYVIDRLNTPAFANFWGTLDGTGKGAARLDTFGPFNSWFVGKTVHFAWAAANPWDFASNAIAVQITP